MLLYKQKKSVAIFGIDVNKINSTGDEITWNRTSNGQSVIVACLAAIEGDPEEHYRVHFSKSVSMVKGELKDAIMPID
ncbi:MAG: hypothetical protein WCK37_02130 [Candidatus Falkowbacteria bacterium]